MLSPSEKKELLEAAGSKDENVRGAYFSFLRDRLKDSGSFPDLKKYADYGAGFGSMSFECALAEEKNLERAVYSALVATPEEEKLLSVEDLLVSVRKIFDLSISSEEYAAYESRKKTFASVTGFLNEKLMELRTGYDKALFIEPGFEEALAKAETFYELTYRRDQKFIEGV